MNLNVLFINPQTGKLRSGWRALFYIGIVLFPRLLLPSHFFGQANVEQSATLSVDPGMVIVYLVLIGWIIFVSWACLRFFEELRLTALGLALHSGGWRDVLKGILISASMVSAIVGLQVIGAGMRIKVNPVLLTEPGRVIAEISAALLLLILAGAFEEVAFRGYAFQTLLRGAPAVVPILLFSILFGIGHWENPSRTFFSTVNTVLAGIWLSVAYLKTRSLWFPIALHFGWNWTMGAFFGIPVSGLLIPAHPLLISTGGDTVWLTGGNYGCEGGATATVVFLISTIMIWRAGWLHVSPEIETALAGKTEKKEETVRLTLSPP